ncbi:MAG: GDP-mannose 4,6-dehydratase [Lachnospiraceae bacterium]|nr:GDP-mannose 4,6-dehydratase [Lachnospiraceae bacterium]
MKKYLITGFSGFVARHFLDHLYDKKEDCEVLGVDVNPPRLDMSRYTDRFGVDFKQVNLLQKDEFADIVREFQPDFVLHLAAFSSVSYSWQHPTECVLNNTNIFLNVAEAVRAMDKPCRILSVGSSEEYGNVDKSQMPLREDMPLKPVSPYAAARVSQELLSKVYVDGFGMDIVLTRSFNHFGPYQDDRFVIPSFLKRIMAIADSGKSEGVIETGDTTIIRDFVDVRDVVRAYYLLLREGEPGEVYNVCGGKGIALSDLITEMADILGVTVEGRVNPDFVRPDDNRVVIGSYDKIYNHVGWSPEISLRQTISDMIATKE